MDILHRGFDGLDIAFQAQISPQFNDALAEAKELAAGDRGSVPLCWNGMNLLVAESGSRGGYAYRCDTGPEGAIWFFKKPNIRDPWGVRVSTKSLPLAVHGLGWVRTDLYKTLASLDIQTQPNKMSISRVDYAIDFLYPDFLLCPNNFVMHARCSRKTHQEITEITEIGHSGKITSVTVGKNPGRQVIIYDKREEIIAKRKVEWPEIWNANRAQNGLPPLDFSNVATSRVWRVELRAFKRHLKDLWGLTTWEHLDTKLGDVLAKMITDIRYAEPTSDTNRARWPDSLLWQAVRCELDADLFEMRSFVDPDRVRYVIKEEQRAILQSQTLGLSVSLAALDGIEPEGFEDYVDETAKDTKRRSRNHVIPIEERIAKAKRRNLCVDPLNRAEI